MFNKILALAIRGGVIFLLGAVILLISDEFGIELGIKRSMTEFIVIAFWVLGGIYALLNFNNSYDFGAIKTVENKVGEIIDDKEKQRIEDENGKNKNVAR